MAVFHDEVEIEDFQYDEDSETYFYPCPCGDNFCITKVTWGPRPAIGGSRRVFAPPGSLRRSVALRLVAVPALLVQPPSPRKVDALICQWAHRLGLQSG